MVRLRVYRGGLASSPEEHALDLASLDGGDTHSSPLQALHAQVYAATGVEARAQYLVYGDAAYPLQDDVDVKALLIHGDESARTVLTLLPAADVRGCVQDACSRVYFGDKPVIQPSYVIPGSEQGVCAACQSLCFPEGLLLAQVGMPLRPFVCGAAALCAEGLGTYLFEERLREAKAICGPGAGHAIQAEEGPGSTTSDAPHVLPPPALALLASFRQAAYVHQALGFQPHNPQANDIMGRLQSGRSTVLAYEAPALRNKALGIIPVATLHERAVAAGGDPQRHPLQFQDALFRELLAWFKHEFFSWTNNAPCERCGSTETTLVGGAAPTPAEQAGKAGRVEVYACPACKAHTRFPRYNDPGVLLDTRRGRCGEWANCFTLCCRALGFPARYCMDWYVLCPVHCLWFDPCLFPPPPPWSLPVLTLPDTHTHRDTHINKDRPRLDRGLERGRGTVPPCRFLRKCLRHAAHVRGGVGQEIVVRGGLWQGPVRGREPSLQPHL